MSDGQTKPSGATPGPDLSGLLRPELSDERARNAAETQFILDAYDKYVHKARKTKGGFLSDELLRAVHSDMFGQIWEWGGKYRKEDLNIGVKWHAIPEEIKKLCDDFNYWASESSKMSAVEVAARLQNRLTRIHLFPNGNGRHARLMTDIFFHSRNLKLPVWPQIQRLPQGDAVRDRYIAAMKKADGEDFNELVKFIIDCIDEKI